MLCVAQCLARAAELERRAADAKSLVAKQDFLRIGASWRGLAVQAQALDAAEFRIDRGYRPGVDGAGRPELRVRQ
jgi:hypothetical protein